MTQQSWKDNPVFDFANQSRDQIQRILNQYGIALSVDEVLEAQSLTNRPLTLAECVLWGIQGSEHCSYKSSKAYLKQLPTQAPNVILGASEDAGILHIASDEHGHQYALAVSHESHNHPSQIVPFGGAATGVGGNIRDVCCMGAEVIALADSLRFGNLSQNHTHWIYEGVIDGIASYGNAVGVPNIGGEVYFESSFNKNCLVTAVTLGLLPADRLLRSKAPEKAHDYDLILVGQPTDRSGFGGASFSSEGFQDDDEDQQSAVQQPNAFLGRVLLKANYLLFHNLYKQGQIQRVGFKDLGAGGIGCASIEMANSAGLGADIWLDEIPLSNNNLLPIVKLCSETQERYLWACPPDLTDTILTHYNETIGLANISEKAQAQVIGKLKNHGRYQVFDKNQCIVDLDANAVCQGFSYNLAHYSDNNTLSPAKPPKQNNIRETILDLLSNSNTASRECLYENYDKQVQGRTIIERGQADAGLVALFNDFYSPESLKHYAASLSLAGNPFYGSIDSYATAVNAVAEAFLKTVSIGATPQAITDCLCFGNPNIPEHMNQFVQSVQGIKNACEHLTLIDNPQSAMPVIAGNVSFHNETEGQAVSASPIISCIGKMQNYHYANDAALKKTGSHLVVLGDRSHNELEGSLYYTRHNLPSYRVPQTNLRAIHQLGKGLLTANRKHMLKSCKTIAQGGMALAIIQMCSLGNFGCVIDHNAYDLNTLLSETLGVICEIKVDKFDKFKQLMEYFDIKYQTIGYVTFEPSITICGEQIDLYEAKQAWQEGLRNKVR